MSKKIITVLRIVGLTSILLFLIIRFTLHDLVNLQYAFLAIAGICFFLPFSYHLLRFILKFYINPNK
jgi:hypothetical protein